MARFPDLTGKARHNSQLKEHSARLLAVSMLARCPTGFGGLGDSPGVLKHPTSRHASQTQFFTRMKVVRPTPMLSRPALTDRLNPIAQATPATCRDISASPCPFP
jgi:hypothetical protein